MLMSDDDDAFGKLWKIHEIPFPACVLFFDLLCTTAAQTKWGKMVRLWKFLRIPGSGWCRQRAIERFIK